MVDEPGEHILHRTLILEVIPITGIDHTLTYVSKNTEIVVGNIVLIPLRNRLVLGLVARISRDTSLSIDQLKEIEYVFFMIRPLSVISLRLIEWLAVYSMASLGIVAKMFLQSHQILKLIEKYDLRMDNEGGQYNLPELSGEQRQAIELIENNLDRYGVYLIEGVTGSGKTAVYSHLIASKMRQDRQVLLLLPEIVLTTQIISRLRNYFGDDICNWHSEITNKERYVNWKKVNYGAAKLIVGARSALFLPYQNLSLIIVDEEHDSSYKQEEGVIYNARDLAILYGKMLNIPVVLVSATPSVETINNVYNGRYNRIQLKQRYGDAVLPKIQIIDLLQYKLKRGRWISSPLEEMMKETINHQLQSMIFINRRGYAPISMCMNCGYFLGCKNCSTNMILHKRHNNMQCHYCGASSDIIVNCPKCNEVIESFGPGAEKIAEEVADFLPNAKIALMTSDTVQNIKHAKEMIGEIERGDIDVIVGTQMIAKGLHFPKLHLVGIVDANFSSAIGDFRSSERMYQMIHQVSGRAGRESKQGLVMIQTIDQDNPMLKHILSHNQEAFYQEEIATRKAFAMPPHTRVVLINASSTSEAFLIGVMHKLARHQPLHNDINIFGPAPSPISILRGKYRYRFILFADKRINIQKFITFWLAKVEIPKAISIKIDIDPYSFV